MAAKTETFQLEISTNVSFELVHFGNVYMSQSNAINYTRPPSICNTTLATPGTQN